MTTIANTDVTAPAGLVPTKPFSQLSSADVPYAGGKGANLGQLTRAGLPVPPGFVVGAPAYAAYRHQTGLAERLDAVLAKLDVEDTAALRAAAEEARRAVRESEMPPWLADAIGAAYDRLAEDEADVPVAVRSSATAEDTASASFAGMNETFLNVRGKRRRDRRGRAVLAVAVRRAHDLLPRAARLQPERHGHRGRGPAPDCLDARRRDVHDRSRHGRARPPGDRGVVRARRIGGLRAGVARPLRGREVDHVDPRALGPAQGADDRGGGRRRHRHPRPRREGEPPPGAERRGGAAAGGARDGDRARVRLAAGHRMGLFPRGADLDAPEPADHDDRRARGDRGGGGPIRNRGGDGTRSGAGRGTGPRRRRGPAAHVAGRGRKA